jgi:hypothetical protein
MTRAVKNPIPLFLRATALCSLLLAPVVRAADSPAASAPATLPGDGLAHRNFLFTGQLDDTLFILRDGKVTWSDRVPGAYGHVQEATLLANGNLLLATMGGVKELTPDKRMVWSYTAPPKCEVHTARPIGANKVLFIQNSAQPFAEVFVADKKSGKIDRLFKFPVGHPEGMHLQTRRAVLTDAGTLLVARTDLNKVTEFDSEGHELWSAAVPRPWSVQRFGDRHTLVCSFEMFIRELDAEGRTVWEFTPKDAPGYLMPKWCVATRLRDGNVLVANNTPPGAGDDPRAPVQAFEVSPDKRIVWALRSWHEPALGPGWIIQDLDEADQAEARHFGSIR